MSYDAYERLFPRKFHRPWWLVAVPMIAVILALPLIVDAARIVISGEVGTLGTFRTENLRVDNEASVGSDATLSGRVIMNSASEDPDGIVQLFTAGPGTTKQVFLKELDANHVGVGSNNEAINLAAFQQATFDTTANPANAIAGDFETSSTRAAGSNILRNIGVLAIANGAQENLGLWVAEGDLRADGFSNLSAVEATSIVDDGPLTVDGLTSTHGIALGAINPAAISGTVDNYTPLGDSSADVVNLSTAGVATLTGFDSAQCVSGRRITFKYRGVDTVAFINGSGASARPFHNPSGATWTLYPNNYWGPSNETNSVTYECDTVTSSWEMVGMSVAVVPAWEVTGASFFDGAAQFNSTIRTSATMQIGGASGPIWSDGAGAPSGACNVGSLYSNTSGGVSTTLYVCTSSGTWTAK